MYQYPGCEICKVVSNLRPEFVIIDGKYWNANLGYQNQTLLGASFITLKRHAYELDELTANEEAELVVIRNKLLKSLRKTFGPLNFNVSCLKNDAFRADPDNTLREASHVHWHIRPRYRNRPVEFAGKVFKDPMPGRYLRTYDYYEPSRETATKIAKAIRQNL